MRLRITLIRDATGRTPVVEAVTVDALGRVSPGYAYTTHAALDKVAVSLNSRPNVQDPQAVQAVLDEWSSSTTPLTLSHVIPEYDTKTVLLEPVETRVAEWSGGGALAARRVLSLTMVDIG
jgi:hypothetical protein